MAQLTEDDDRLHADNGDPWWSETCWFSVDQPGEDVSVTLYPVFRRPLGICSLSVYVWDPAACEPWAIPYGRAWWHLPFPDGDLDDLELQGLRYRVVEPLQRYEVGFRDGDDVAIDLEYVGLRPPNLAFRTDTLGHVDQPCRVTGSIRIGSRKVEVDTVAMRDRTWAPRPDTVHGRSTAYTYGTASADEQFLVLTSPQGNEGTMNEGVFRGYLVQDGEAAALASATRRVVERRNGWPVRIELDVTDERGRRLEATGLCRNRLANQANPAQFAWMSMTAWTSNRGDQLGEDQEVWSPDLLGPPLLALDT